MTADRQTDRYTFSVFVCTEEKFTMNIPAKEYIANCDESKCMYGYVCATDVKKDLPYSDYVSFTVQMPKLTISVSTLHETVL